MTRINTNIASLRGLRSLNKSTQQLDTAMTRLSTGLKINSGRDNPSGLIASEGLRTQISAIEQSIKNSNRANNVIATADSALGEIGGLLTQVRGLVQEGLNTGALSQDEIEANQLQIDNALSAINRIASNTKFGSDKLIDGSKSFNTNISTVDAAKFSDVRINEAVIGSSGSISLDAQVTRAAEKGSLIYSGGNLSAATNLEIGGSTGSEVIFLGSNSSVANIRDAINNATDTTGVTAKVISGYTENIDASSASIDVDATTGGPGTLSVTADTAGTTGNDYSIEFVAGTGNDVATSAAFGTGADANKITVTLGTDGSGALDATKNTLGAIATAVGNLDGVSATSTGTGSINAATANASLAGGAGAGSFVLSDVRTPGSVGDISVALLGGTSQSLGVTVTTTGDDTEISVQLATDAEGNVTSTLDDVADAINGVASLKDVTLATVSGDGNAIADTAGYTPASAATAASANIAIGTPSVAATTASLDVSGDTVAATAGLSTAATVGGPGTVDVSADAAGVAGNSFSVEYVAGTGNGVALSAALAGNKITVTLGTDAGGALDATKNTVALIAAQIDGIAGVSATSTGAGSVNAAVAEANLTGGVDAAAGTGTLSVSADAAGADGNGYSVEFVQGAGNDVALSAAFGTGPNANKITVTLGTDSSGNLDASKNTLALIAAQVDGLNGVGASATGSGSVTAAAANASLTGGADSVPASSDTGSLTVTAETAGTAGNDYAIEFIAGSGNNTALSAAFGTGADANKVFVTLGTDASGNLDATKNTVSLIATAVDGLTGVAATSTGTGAVSAAAAAVSLTGGAAATTASNSAVDLSEATGGALSLESDGFGSDQYVNVNVLAGAFTTTLADGTEARRNTGTDIGVTINGQQAIGRGLRATLRTGNLDASLTIAEASNVVDTTANVTIAGGGAVFQIGQEVSAAGQIGIGIEAINTARLGGVTGKLYELGSGAGKSLIDITRGDANGGDVVQIIEEAINKVSTLRGRLGAVQKNVIDTNVATLGVALENISEARSQIVDTDFAEETANLTKAQVLNQAGIAVLSIANQNPQQVLQLLG